jgi:hypothetical protein
MRGVLSRIFRFVNVDPDFYPGDLVPANPSQRVRSARLQFYLRRRIEPALVKLRLHPLRRWVDRLALRNVVAERPAPLSPQTRQYLMTRYRGDLETLDRLTGLDTSAWRKTQENRGRRRAKSNPSESDLQGSGPHRLT